MNIICFTGNVGRDGEMRYTPSGDAVLGFSVALTSGFGDKKITTWLNCTLWGRRAESLDPYIKKGIQVAINGEFTARAYNAKDGSEKLSLEVRVNDVTLMGGKSDNNTSESPKDNQNETQAPSKTYDPMDFDDDIPF